MLGCYPLSLHPQNTMPNFQAVAKNTHFHLRWKRYTSYAFAAQDALVPLVAQELSRAALHLPIALVARDAQGTAFAPMAVLGLQPNQNLFVAPDGRWLGGYTPAAYRAHPFALASTPDGQLVLAVDADSGLITEAQDEGEAFCDSEGKPVKALQDVVSFLTQVQASKALTERICAVLVEHQLIQPWSINVQTSTGERQLSGLHRIDETALNALPADALKALQQAGALPLIYCQLLSMQHLAQLGTLAQAHAKAQANANTKTAQPLPTTPQGDLDLSFLSNAGTLNFGSV